jgi:hypothetical protein
LVQDRQRSRWTASRTLLALLTGFVALSNGAPAQTSEPTAACKPGVTDDTLVPLPAMLTARAKQLLHLAMPDELIRKTTVYRCVDGRTLLCTTGANLACGRANTDRDPPGVAAWCREHRQSDAVPMFVTGHDTIYRWHCTDGTPRIEAAVEPVDARGFLSRNWKDAGR